MSQTLEIENMAELLSPPSIWPLRANIVTVIFIMYYPRQGGGVCLFVCLLTTSHKNSDRIFIKILSEMYLHEEKLIKFWKSFACVSKSEIVFRRILQRYEVRHILQFSSCI